MTKTLFKHPLKGDNCNINPLLQVPDKNRKTKPREVLPSSINGVEKSDKALFATKHNRLVLLSIVSMSNDDCCYDRSINLDDEKKKDTIK